MDHLKLSHYDKILIRAQWREMILPGLKPVLIRGVNLKADDKWDFILRLKYKDYVAFVELDITENPERGTYRADLDIVGYGIVSSPIKTSCELSLEAIITSATKSWDNYKKSPFSE